MRLLEELSVDNFEYAEYLLGKLYYQGEDITQDISKAVYHLERAFAVGNQFAAYQLGKIYLNELQDTDKAVFYLKAAAEEGNPYAQYQLGKLYLYGNGVEKDVALAYEYLIESAKKRQSLCSAASQQPQKRTRRVCCYVFNVLASSSESNHTESDRAKQTPQKS